MQPDPIYTIVVVDRDPFVADVLMQALREGVGATICALTTARATDVLASARWRLAVVDVRLGWPGVDIAAAAVEMGTPVVLLTGDLWAADRLRRYGFAVLQKPISMACLVQEARMTISRSWGVCHAFTIAAACMLKAEGALWCKGALGITEHPSLQSSDLSKIWQ